MFPTITEGLEDPASMQVALNRPTHNSVFQLKE